MHRIMAVGNILLRARIKGALRGPYHIVESSTNDEALEIMRGPRRSDLVIAKTAQPGILTYEFIARLRGNPGQVSLPVILIADEHPVSMKAARSLGANAVLPFPFEDSKLIESVKSLLEVPKRGASRVLICVKVEGRRDLSNMSCFTVNISSTGLLIETDQELYLGEEVKVSFQLPFGGDVEADCKVVRSLPSAGGIWQYGVEFVRIATAMRDRVAAFVDLRC